MDRLCSNEGNMFDKGQRVVTPGGAGEVVYKRMAPPTYAEVDVYSVKLDARKGDPTYSGTIYKANQVQKE